MNGTPDAFDSLPSPRARRPVQPRTGRACPTSALAQPDTIGTIQPGGRRRRHRGPRLRGRGCRTWRQGGDHRASCAGRRLPELRLCAVQGSHPRGEGRRRRPRGRGVRRRAGSGSRPLRHGDGPSASCARGHRTERLCGSPVRSGDRRILRAGTLPLVRRDRRGGAAADICPRYRRDRRTSHRSAHSWPRRSGVPDERDRVLAHRVAAASRGDWRRANRL